MLVIHHLGRSQSERIVWLCEELALPYELVRYDRDPETRLAPAELKALHPFGTAPVLDDGPMRATESGAIVEYVVYTHGRGRLTIAPGADCYTNYLFWWHFANASFLPAAMMDGLVRHLGGSDSPLIRSLQARHDLAYDLIETRLAEARYFAGEEFTVADIMMVFPLSTMRSFSERSISGFPNIQAYLRRIGERPAYRRAMAKGDPDMVPVLS